MSGFEFKSRYHADICKVLLETKDIDTVEFYVILNAVNAHFIKPKNNIY